MRPLIISPTKTRYYFKFNKRVLPFFVHIHVCHKTTDENWSDFLYRIIFQWSVSFLSFPVKFCSTQCEGHKHDRQQRANTKLMQSTFLDLWRDYLIIKLSDKIHTSSVLDRNVQNLIFRQHYSLKIAQGLGGERVHRNSAWSFDDS